MSHSRSWVLGLVAMLAGGGSALERREMGIDPSLAQAIQGHEQLDVFEIVRTDHQ